MSDKLEVAVFGGGCFWCIEAVFQRVIGVEKVVFGYAGGSAGEVSYGDLHARNTGHAEVIEISFDPEVVTYEQLLEIFWTVHDPTTPNRQGHDIGPEYRSIILTSSENQLKTANESRDNTAPQLWDNPIVTEIQPLNKFYVGKDFHQNYYNSNKSSNPYCQVIIDPKLAKFKSKFQHLMKKEDQ